MNRLRLFLAPILTALACVVIAAEHVYSRQTNTGISDPEFQITVGMKWATRIGVWGVGLTENLFNYDNTPDIADHLSWGMLFERPKNHGSL